MIAVSEPQFGKRERELLMLCLDTGRITMGPAVAEFESKFSHHVNVKHALACSSGTSALHLALLALGIGEGDQVIVPALSYVATANAVRYCGATPVFADVDPITWCISPSEMDEVYTSRVKAVIVVQLYGSWPHMLAVQEHATRHKIKIVEDAAEGLGGTFAEKSAGTIGDIGAFSFYGNKTITTAEGGMVVTNNDHYAEQVRLYRGQGRPEASRPYHHTVVGYNYRMTDLHAAIGIAQLERLEDNLAKRRQLFQFYQSMLPWAGRPYLPSEEYTSSNWMYAMLLPKGMNRESVMKLMFERGVETRPVFDLLPTLPPYTDDCDTEEEIRAKFPIAAEIADRGLCLPTSPQLVESNDCQTVVDVLMTALQKERTYV